MIDTGTDVSAISRNVYEQKFNTANFKRIATPGHSIVMADGTKVPTPDKIELPITIQGKIYKILAYIVNKLDQDLILGCEFLRKHEAVKDFEKNKLSLHKDIPVCVKDTTTIPPHSEVILNG